jgi:hypothetical protein
MELKRFTLCLLISFHNDEGMWRWTSFKIMFQPMFTWGSLEMSMLFNHERGNLLLASFLLCGLSKVVVKLIIIKSEFKRRIRALLDQTCIEPSVLNS